MRLMPIKLSLGLHLAEDIYDINGKLLVRKGSAITDQQCQRIAQNNIYSVYITDQYSDGFITPVIPMQLKYEMTTKLRNLFKSVRDSSDSQKNQHQIVKQIDDILETLKDIEYELNGRKKNYIDFIDIKSTSTYSYEHSVNVAVLSFLLGKHSGLSSVDLHHLIIGALFHDIGMTFIDQSIFMKNGKLDLAEFIKIKQHPELGYNFIKDQSFANAYIKIIALQHHERLDGSGYPKGIMGDDIHRLARHVAIIDMYDAMTSDRPYSAAVPAYSALEYMMASAIGKLDFQLTKIFVDIILPYPVGTCVQLSDKRIAAVNRVDETMSRRPVVQIIDPVKKVLTGTFLNLADAYKLTVDGVVFRI